MGGPMLLFLLLVVVPAIEIYLFIEIGGALGSGWTMMLIVLTALWGARAMRRQGLAVLARPNWHKHAAKHLWRK